MEGAGPAPCAAEGRQAEAPYAVESIYGGPSTDDRFPRLHLRATSSPCRAKQLCNEYSLNHRHRRDDRLCAGVLRERLPLREDTGGLDWFGNGEAMVEMVERIARLRGLGDVLAGGLLPAAARIGRGADYYAVRQGPGPADARARLSAKRPSAMPSRPPAPTTATPSTTPTGDGRGGRPYPARRPAWRWASSSRWPSKPGAGKGARHDL